jgi:hypothetical protein
MSGRNKSDDATEDKADFTKQAHPPVEFHAVDRYHAMTHVAQSLERVPNEVKARVHAALDGLQHHDGPVHVLIPAPPPAAGAEKPKRAKDAPDDPMAPDDGAFAVKPYRYVQV